MKILNWLAPATLVMSFGCSNAPGGQASGGNDTNVGAKFGELTLALTGADSAGQPYRLRNANFDIGSYYYYYPYGYPGAEGDGGAGQVVSSETDPEASVISTRLLPGNYSVSLENNDWYLEKVTAAGGERVAESLLLSERTQYAYIYDRGSTDVTFRFGVDGQLIDFRHGDLNIGIQIEHPDEDAGVPPPVVQDGGVDAR